MHHVALLIFYLALGLQASGDAHPPAPLKSLQSFGDVSCGCGQLHFAAGSQSNLGGGFNTQPNWYQNNVYIHSANDNFVWSAITSPLNWLGTAETYLAKAGVAYVPIRPTDPYFDNIEVMVGWDDPRPSPLSPAFNVACGSYYEPFRSDHGTSKKNIQSEDNCQFLLEEGRRLHQIGRFQAAYDTLRRYMLSCANERGAMEAIGLLGSANQERSDDLYRYVEHREWLKSILYSRLDNVYYCLVSQEILATLYFHETRGKDDLASWRTVLKFLIETNRCPDSEDDWKGAYVHAMELWQKRWRDTVTVDTTLYPFDSAQPTLEDLGLEILRGPSSVASNTEQGSAIVKMILNENPFKADNEATIELTKPVLAQLSLHDAMGSLVWGSNDLVRLPEGVSRYPLETSGLASGTYYLRLGTSQGEVRTIKLTKVK